MVTFDVAVLGGGCAGAFAVYRAIQKHKNAKILLVEGGAKWAKRRGQACGWLGFFPTSDGKFYLKDIDDILDLADGRRVKSISKWVMELLEEAGPLKITKDSLPNSTTVKKINELGFNIQTNDYIQWTPNYIHSLSKIMALNLEEAKNLTATFDNEIYKVYKKKNHFIISTQQGEFTAKKVIWCVGRIGWRLSQELFKDLGLLNDDNWASFGVRVEINSQHLKHFNRSHCLLTKENLEVGKFSWNGTVIPEDHLDCVVSNFRSNESRWNSDKVSFSILGSKYFEGEGAYQTERLAKLPFLLFNDRVGRERLKTINKGTSQLSLLPEYNWLSDVLKELETFIPQLLIKGYYYAPNIKPIPGKILLGNNLESEVENLFVAGESTGKIGLLSAAISGGIAMDAAC